MRTASELKGVLLWLKKIVYEKMTEIHPIPARVPVGLHPFRRETLYETVHPRALITQARRYIIARYVLQNLFYFTAG